MDRAFGQGRPVGSHQDTHHFPILPLEHILTIPFLPATCRWDLPRASQHPPQVTEACFQAPPRPGEPEMP